MPEPGFHDLAGRLVERTRHAVRSGRFTERSLARLIGYSQPHVHNVLRGKRSLHPDFADALLEALSISALDLLAPESTPSRSDALQLPAFDGALGGGAPFPKLGPDASFALDSRLPLDDLEQAAAARVASREHAMLPLIEPGDWIVLDCSPRARVRPDFASVYALEIDGMGFLARCRLVGERLLTVTDGLRLRSGPPPFLDLKGYAGSCVRGQVVWTSRRLGSIRSP